MLCAIDWPHSRSVWSRDEQHTFELSLSTSAGERCFIRRAGYRGARNDGDCGDSRSTRVPFNTQRAMRLLTACHLTLL